MLYQIDVGESSRYLATAKKTFKKTECQTLKKQSVSLGENQGIITILTVQQVK